MSDFALLSKDPLDRVTAYLVGMALEYPAVEKIVLYGSRARGDHQERSDFDVCVFASNISDEDWIRFSLDVQEDCPTLCDIDLLLVTKNTSKDLLKRILTEGKTLYDFQKK